MARRRKHVASGKLPWWQRPEVSRILMTLVLLTLIVVLRKPCSDAAGRFIADFDGSKSQVDAAPALAPGPKSAVPEGTQFIEITPNMSEEEVRKAFESLKKDAPQQVPSQNPPPPAAKPPEN